MIKLPPALDRWQKVLGPELLPGNKVLPLVRGQATFRAMVQAVRTATRRGHYIYLLGWSFSRRLPIIEKTRIQSIDDPDKGTMLDLMAEAIGRGVQVRVMLNLRTGEFADNAWAVNDLNTLGRDERWDVAAILDGYAVHDALAVGIVDDPISLEPPIPVVEEVKLKFASHHQKVLLVHGERGLIGFCGGVDIFKDRVLDVGEGSPQHDVHCQIEGPAAHVLMDVFAQRWYAHPDHERIDNTKGRLMGLAARSTLNRPKKGDQFVRIARTANFVDSQPVVSSCQGEHSVRSMMLDVIRNAKRFIYIEDQYLALEEAAEEIKRMIPTLQHVTVVVPHPELEPQFSFRRRKFLQTLRSAPDGARKVRAYHAVSDEQGARGRFSYIHAKTWIVDDEVAVIGSANCNNRGWSYDSEVVAAIVDCDPRAPGTSFAQKLRMKLWSIHLGVPQSEVVWGHGSKVDDQWSEKRLSGSKDARVRPYDEKYEVKDNSRYTNMIDPAADFPACEMQWLRQRSIVSRAG